MGCTYSNIFGESGTGVHRHRFAGIAIVDLLATIAVAWAIHKVSGKSFAWISIGLIVLGIIVHRLMCVNTALNVKIFGQIEQKQNQ